MAIITCAACGARVNDDATGCPACGADPRSGAPGRFTALPGTPGRPGLDSPTPHHDILGVALTMYRRNLAWLLLGGTIAAVVEIVAVRGTVEIGLGHGAITGFPATTSPFGAAAYGFVALAFALLVAELLAFVLRGGMTRMAIDSARSGRPGELATLFAGFRRFGSFAGLWGLTELALPLGLVIVTGLAASTVGPLALLVGLAGVLVLIWLLVRWVYGMALIADRGVRPLAALAGSSDMVADKGWWATFGPLFALGFATACIGILVSAVARGTGAGAYLTLTVDEVVLMPFVTCFIASMYLGAAPAEAVPGYGPPPPGQPTWGQPLYGQPTYGPPTCGVPYTPQSAAPPSCPPPAAPLSCPPPAAPPPPDPA